MSGTERLSRKQEAGVLALLTHATFAEAAASIGVGESTLRRWSTLPAFTAALKAERRRVVDHVVALLQGVGAETVGTLLELRDSGPPPVRVRAAVALLHFMLKSSDVDFEQRLAALEAQAAEIRGVLAVPALPPNDGGNGHRAPW